MAIAIVLAGMVTVIVGILVFRLPAFIALVLAALLVAVATPENEIQKHELRKSGFAVAKIDDGEIVVRVSSKQSLEKDVLLSVLRTDGEKVIPVATVRVVGPLKVGSARTRCRIEKRLDEFGEVENLLAVANRDWKAANKTAGKSVGSRVAEGFGSTAAKIGILIAMAAIIGKCLLDSGAAERIVRSLLRLFGERGAPRAFASGGFLLGIPVFFDTVFYLMIPLGKAFRMRTGRNYLLAVLTIVAGATMAHSLVPPTPGPLFVAEELGVDIGLMILMGCGVGLVTVFFGYFYAVTINRFCELPLRDTDEFSTQEMEQVVERPDSELPPLWLSLMPILLPVLLLAGGTVLAGIDGKPDWLAAFAKTFGDKNIALTLGAGIAVYLLVRQKKTSRKELGEALQASLMSAGMIILITAAGGAFGRVLQQTGIANLLRDLPTASPWIVLVLAFFITTAVRTAQGSATVAMITAVGVLSGIAASGDLTFHPVYLALAIGCGSKPIAWMNDSGFWVITRMSGMTEAEGLKYITPMTACMGLVGLGTVLVLATVFPMV